MVRKIFLFWVLTFRKWYDIINLTVRVDRYYLTVNTTTPHNNGEWRKIMNTNENKNTNRTFFDVVRDYETDVINNNDYANSLQALGVAIALSVLKKCINVSSNPRLIAIRRELIAAVHNLDNIARINMTAYDTAYNTDGERYTAIIDKDGDNAIHNINADGIGGGLDLAHTAIIAVLEETQKARARATNGTLTANFLTTPYTIRRLKKRVIIKKSDSINGFETVETMPITEIYKAVRREISASGALQRATSGYTYIEDIATDGESDASDIIYRRFGKYADIGGVVRDVNGTETAYTTDAQTVADVDNIIESLNLTARQLQVLQLRISGYGIKSIGTYLGVSHQAIAKTLKQIQAKALTIGYKPIN